MGGKPRLMDGMDNSLSHVGFFQAARLLMLPLLIDKLHDVFEAAAASPLIHSHDLWWGNCSLLLMLVWNSAHGLTVRYSGASWFFSTLTTAYSPKSVIYCYRLRTVSLRAGRSSPRFPGLCAVSKRAH